MSHASPSALRRLVAATLAAALLVTAAIVPATAASPKFPDRIDLPNGWQPEGIESWGRWLYAGSLADGSIWRADARTGEGRILVDGPGLPAAGLHIDDQGRLWVAGGPSGQIRVYDARTGEPLATYQFPVPSFINDLDLVDGAVYATNSVEDGQWLAVVPLGDGGALPDPSAATILPLTGAIDYEAGFNLNGIVQAGELLVAVQSNTNTLFRIDPATGDAQAIDIGAYVLTNGDGLELRGDRLYVVRNQVGIVAVFRLSDHRLSAMHLGDISPATGSVSVPTTATLALGSLYVVNARFGVPPTPETDYWITRLPARP